VKIHKESEDTSPTFASCEGEVFENLQKGGASLVTPKFV